MPLAYVKPEEAFEVRIQCSKEQIIEHCNADPTNDRRDFDDKGGLQISVYHVYKGTNYPDPLTYWYTLDECEDEQYEFDIRTLPTRHDSIVSRRRSSTRFGHQPSTHRRQPPRDLPQTAEHLLQESLTLYNVVPPFGGLESTLI